MNPYVTDPSLYGQYYPMGQPQHGSPHGAYAAYYNAAYASAQNTAAAAHVVASATGQHPGGPATISAYTAQSRPQIVPQLTHNPQRALTTIHPTPSDSSNNSINPDISVTTSTDTSIQNAMASWQQLKQGTTMTTTKSGSSLFPTKTFVKASSATRVGGSSDNAGITEPNHNIIPSSYDCTEANQICSKLHEVAVLNRLVEVYEKIDCELSPGIHGVRLRLGNEVYQGTGSNFQAAKRNAAGAAMAQTNYRRPIDKPTLRPRIYRSPTAELYELAQRKAVEVKLTFLRPEGFERKKIRWNIPKEELFGTYEVQICVVGNCLPNVFEAIYFFGSADLPKVAKHNASREVLPFLRNLQDSKSFVKSLCAGFVPNAADGSIKGSTGEIISKLHQYGIARGESLVWDLVEDNGPLHTKFIYSLRIGPFEAQGGGKSKKIAKIMAAHKVNELLPSDWKIPKKKVKSSDRSKGRGKRRKQSITQKNSEIMNDVTQLESYTTVPQSYTNTSQSYTNTSQSHNASPLSYNLSIADFIPYYFPQFSLPNSPTPPNPIINVNLNGGMCYQNFLNGYSEGFKTEY